MQGTPSIWHTDGIFGLASVPPFSSVTTVRPITCAVAITKGVCTIAILCGLHQQGMLPKYFARGSLDVFAERNKQLRSNFHPLRKLILLPSQLDTDLLRAESHQSRAPPVAASSDSSLGMPFSLISRNSDRSDPVMARR
jgi:hypothetical protein